VLSARLRPLVDHTTLVLSPEGRGLLERGAFGAGAGQWFSWSVQEQPTGMGDAIFCGFETWKAYDDIVVVWGDQLGLQPATIGETIRVHRAGAHPRCTFPVARVRDPYVEYLFEGQDYRLTRVLQSREGDRCSDVGLADVGTFMLSTAGLAAAWADFADRQALGAQTHERNFLPFLPFLARRPGWAVTALPIAHPDETRGLNGPEDLAYFSERLSG
jgi:bifunctional UDP-N-acetylglucosamine pyrophosphorylase/glucosamine-1-phosphate N-acetyltransferase